MEEEGGAGGGGVDVGVASCSRHREHSRNLFTTSLARLVVPTLRIFDVCSKDSPSLHT